MIWGARGSISFTRGGEGKRRFHSPESFIPILVLSLQRIWYIISLKLVLQSSLQFFVNFFGRYLQDCSPLITTSSVISYRMQYGCSVRANTSTIVTHIAHNKQLTILRGVPLIFCCLTETPRGSPNFAFI